MSQQTPALDLIDMTIVVTNVYPELGVEHVHQYDVEALRPTLGQLLDPEQLEQWAAEELMIHTGEGPGAPAETAVYFVAVVACRAQPELVGREFQS